MTKYTKKGTIKTIAMAMMIFASVIIMVFANANEARPDYGLSYDTFALLPPVPDDFESMKININATMDFDVGEEYYKQPEFYPTFSQFIDTMKNPPKDRIAIWGVGVYPSRHEYAMLPQNEFNIVAYAHTSWMVQTFQGAYLEADYNADYFDVSVSPDTMLLGPAYPRFDNNWAQKITVKVYVKNAPKGTYDIIINPKPADEKKIQDWRAKYKGLFVSMPASSPDQPYLKITVNVV